LVFTELLKWRNSEVYFFHDQKECDFIVRKEGQLIALQVTIELTSANREREILGLNAALDKFSIPKGYILTRDAEYKKLDHRVEIMSCIEFFVNKASVRL
jgi:predicted AAA+ superfamily ATPase